MKNIIVTTSEELRAIISEEVSKAFPVATTSKELPDTITLDTAVQVLEEYGFPTSKAKIYKLTSAGTMPFRKYGNKLIFSRIELLDWAEQQVKSPHDPSNVIESINRNVMRKRQGGL
ncbi:DNA-binding protein [Parabacteroides sp. 52]|uniref:helix-turn-helix domain-containing protein n=1 Tax=unclassified Parabacteroides TaxID=2649774 RepID=UPI0013D058CE|nr:MULTISPECIES: helix-turn-helix domain-containing protein [unclassified Parabacteroides]MDH6535706.1 hypothetical protein [Parabacteroides sp. PM5-20]MDL2265537.1 helix-turn-helix domain-containing protein [Parabacteroides sp. OttesenSCG-928-G21]MDL2277013.1 helix-turn-helix domain-containing protein [Parabacteroides sp. OttesenSCG-928-G07]NDV56409.1 DNA-binding protein [Parabacteroides sp. 52]